MPSKTPSRAGRQVSCPAVGSNICWRSQIAKWLFFFFSGQKVFSGRERADSLVGNITIWESQLIDLDGDGFERNWQKRCFWSEWRSIKRQNAAPNCWMTEIRKERTPSVIGELSVTARLARCKLMVILCKRSDHLLTCCSSEIMVFALIQTKLKVVKLYICTAS